MSQDFEELAGRSRSKSDDESFARLIRMFRRYGNPSHKGKIMSTRKAIETLTLRRRGAFQLVTKGDSHCGVGDNITVKYEVVAECEYILDERGFLFEQRNVDAYFQRMRSTRKSCELLTKKTAKDLAKMIMEENPSCFIRKLTVNLSPEPFAADMTYTWEMSE